MNVSIIGAGNMARGIGLRLVAGGHHVTLHVQNKAKGQALAQELGHDTAVVQGGLPESQIVILAVPYAAMSAIAKNFHGLAGKVVVDSTNPVDFKTFQLIPEPGQSGAQEVAKLLPEAKVVKAFNTVFASILAAGTVAGQTPDVFVAADDVSAKEAVTDLVNSSGLRAVDAGSLANARHLEGIQLIHMSAQQTLGTNWQSALQIVS